MNAQVHDNPVEAFQDDRESARAVLTLIGQRIEALRLDPDDSTMHLQMAGVAELILWDDARCCCERRYMTTEDDLQAFVGAELRGIEVREAAKRGEGCEQVDIQFLLIATSHGVLTLTSYNEHNGFYAGFEVRARLAQSPLPAVPRSTPPPTPFPGVPTMSPYFDFSLDSDTDLALMDAYEPDPYDRKLRRRGVWEGYFRVDDDLPWDDEAPEEPIDDAELDALFEADCCAACGAPEVAVTTGRDNLCWECYQGELRDAA